MQDIHSERFSFRRSSAPTNAPTGVKERQPSLPDNSPSISAVSGAFIVSPTKQQYENYHSKTTVVDSFLWDPSSPQRALAFTPKKPH